MRLLRQPADQFVQFTRLIPFLTPQHGDCKIADVLGARPGSLARRPFQQGRRFQQAMEPSRRVTEERPLLFEVNVDAAEENRRAAALILLVQRHWQIKGDHQDFLTLLTQRGDKRVVAETVSAVHAARAGGDLDDVHSACSVANDAASRFVIGRPYGKGAGTSANSLIAVHRRVKSLFTSPLRQSVMSPARSGYLSVNSRKLKSGS